MRIIASDALDRFYGYIPQKSREMKERLTPHTIGDFTYYDCEEIAERLPKKAKVHFAGYLEHNPLQVHEYPTISILEIATP